MSNEKIDLSTIELPSNEPKYYKDYENYSKVLEKKLEDPSITNIGIVAPYGAGKSSLIKTFVEGQSKKFKKRIISVSLANYSSIMQEVKEDEKPLYEYNNEQNIEKSILQQLFYRNDNKKTPYSRFVVLKDKKRKNILTSFLIVLVFASMLFLGFQSFDNILKIDSNDCEKKLYLILAIIVMLGSLGILLFIFINNKYLKSIHVGELSFEKNEDTSISVFNQYLDEIIYFFQKNSFNILIIEDLDRFENLQIFSKLKELNALLNKNDKIRSTHGKITFIYAVKDSMFKNEEERSKFFEFILPVIPSLTSDNVQDELEHILIEKFGQMPLSPQLVVDISDYISSRRILNNVISDFIIHISILHIEQTKEKMDKLFSLMVLKNILPLEYEKLQNQNDTSDIYTYLNKEKKKMIDELIKTYNQQKKDYQKQIEEIDKETLNSINELKYIFYGLVCKEYPNCNHVDYQLDTFENKTTIHATYNHYYDLPLNISSIALKYYQDENYFMKKERSINKKNSSFKNDSILKIQNIEQITNQIKNMNFAELFSKYEENIGELKFNNKFVKLVLVNGYIDETYMDYLSKHSSGFITANDREIIKKINRKDTIDLLEKIDSPEKVIIKLNGNKFSLSSILNYYIINELVINKSKYFDKFNVFISALSHNETNQKNVKKFIEGIINSKVEYMNLIVQLCIHVPYLWDTIYNSKDILEEVRAQIFFCLINDDNIDVNVLDNLNKNKNVSNQINLSKNFCKNFHSKNIPIELLYEKTQFCLSDLGSLETNENNNIKYVLKNNLYDLNFNNLSCILKDYYKKSDEEILTKNYDLICELDSCPLKERIMTNLNQYLRIVYNSISFGLLSNQNLIALLINETIDEDLKATIVEKEKSIITYNPKLNTNIIEILLRKKQITLSIEDILKTYNSIDQGLMIKFIEENSKNVQISEELLKENNEFKRYFFDNINIGLFIDKIGSGYKNISALSNTNNINILLKYHLVSYDINDFKVFLDKNSYLKEYCDLFEDELCNDIANKTIQLSSDGIKLLYFVTKNKNRKIFAEILKLVTGDILEDILKEENINDFINSIENLNHLSISCKKSILNNTDNKSIIEDVLVALTEISNQEWIDLFKKINHFNNSKEQYTYASKKFYDVLKTKVTCNRRNGVATIHFEKCAVH